MRKHQQRQILELLKTAVEAQEAGLYADCQECAIAVGEYIEGIVGEGTQTVALLEEYCDLLFKASNGEISGKSLAKHLIKVENSVKNELKPDKIEVAFFPYQPSMWDALESIYFEAVADSNCDAFVIPIPYYELNPDRSLGKIHYKGDEYPKDIPVTDWREYDIEARHPDVIFTHYAYDDNVNNATVHPNFYHKRLRNFCDLLIHVPYYVHSGSYVQDYLVFLPGILFSHHVVIQSEEVRQIYIAHYNKVDKENGWNCEFGKAEDKFLALGSPKFDKVVNTKKEDYKIPDEWSRLINNDDGSQKKVILYNTHMFAWISGGSAYFDKIRYVFEIFKGRNDIVLWWRPHPNTELNFRVKRLDLYSEYISLVDEYRSEVWGIYDDTPDLHRAIAWSDAYYGDPSSVLILYGATGKPAMVGNPDVLTDETQLLPSSFHVDDKYIWFSARYINALIRVDKSTMEAEYVCSFPGEGDYTWTHGGYMYGECAEKDGEIYFAPFVANEVAVYSKNTDSIEKIVIECNVDGIGADILFWGAVTTDDSVFFISCNHPVIIRIDTLRKEAYCYADLVKPVDKLSGKQFGFSHPIATAASIWAILSGTNAMIQFDIKTYKSSIHRIGKEEWSYSGICFDGENYWLSPLHGTETPVVKYNPKTGSVREISEVTSMDPSRSHYILCSGGYVWLLPHQAKHAFKIDIKTDAVSIAQEFESDTDDSSAIKYQSVQTHGSNIYAYRNRSGVLIQYDTATKERGEEAIRYPAETFVKLEPLIAKQFSVDYSAMNTESDCWYHENGSAPLSNYVEHISKNNDSSEEIMRKKRQIQIFKSNNANADGTAGQAICDFVKNLVLK